jgi:hypothetical protein
VEPEPEPKFEPEYLYGVRDGQVVEFRIAKRTPMFVKFATATQARLGSAIRSRTTLSVTSSATC